MNYTSSCHCGQLKVSFETTLEKVIECNCSHCRKKGYLLTFMPKAQTQLTLPEGAYNIYTFNKHVVQHHFCKTCGCAPFGISKGHDGVTETVAINLRCLDVPLDLSTVNVIAYDGASA